MPATILGTVKSAWGSRACPTMGRLQHSSAPVPGGPGPGMSSTAHCAAWRPRGSPSPHGRQRGPSHRGGRRPAGGLGSEWAPVRSTVRGPWAGGRAGSFRGAGRARPRSGLRRRRGGPREASLDAAELLLSPGAPEGLRSVGDAPGLGCPLLQGARSETSHGSLLRKVPGSSVPRPVQN